MNESNIITPENESITLNSSFIVQKPFGDSSVIMCENHLNNNEDNVPAERYCLECKVPVCSSCIIDYHEKHVNRAKIKISEFLASQKIEVDKLKNVIIMPSQKAVLLDNLNEIINKSNNELDRYYAKRKEQLEEMKNSIDRMILYEEKIIIAFKEMSRNAYQELHKEKLQSSFDLSSEISLKILKFIESWEEINDSMKLDIIKGDNIQMYRRTAINNSEILKEECQKVKDQLNVLLGHFKNMQGELNKKTNCLGIELEIRTILDTLKEKFEYFSKVDPLQLAKGNGNNQGHDFIMNSFQPQINRNVQQMNFSILDQNNDNQSNWMNRSDERKDNQASNNFRSSIVDNNKENNYNNNDKMFQSTGNINSSIFQQDENQDIKIKNKAFTFGRDDNRLNNDNNYKGEYLKNEDIIKTSFIEGNNFNYDFVISIKPNSNTIKIFESSLNSPCSYFLSQKMFGEVTCALNKFPNNCRFVNLGFSLLITGGTASDGIQINNSFLLLIQKKKEAQTKVEDNYEIVIMPYSQMLDGRERHCLVNLHDKNKVLACSGFQKNSAEITNLTSGTWTKIADLTERRANASIAYTNQRYVWVIAGFKLNESKQGVYLNSAEVFDTENEQGRWKFIDFAKFNNSIKLTAAGVLNSSKNIIMLCGGYDGVVYLKDIYTLDITNDSVNSFAKSDQKLSEENIFFHSNFVKCGGCAVNFDYKLDLNIYNPLTREFGIFK